MTLFHVRFCPACIEFADSRKDGRKKLMYLFVCMSDMPASKDNSPKLRTYQEFSKSFSVMEYPKISKNTRISVSEKNRREIVITYQDYLKRSTLPNNSKLRVKLEEFLGTVSDGDRSFLENSSPVKIRSRSSNVPDKWEGSVLMAMDRRHWIEKSLMVTTSEVRICRHSDSRRSSISIPINSVLGVKILTKEEAPFQYYSYFQIETFSRVYTFMVKSQIESEAWISVFVSLRGSKIVQPPNLKNFPVPGVTEPEELFFGRPSSFKMDKRTLFNYRRIVFHRSTCVANTSNIQNLSPNELVEKILDKGFKLQAAEGSADAAQWVDFMDALCGLQTIDICELNETSKICLLLNLYHTMVLHGMLLLGPPASWSSWPSFFNTVSYMVGYDVFSINELEHNGLR
jgi:hypothetical protein